MTPAQCRAARALLAWTQGHLSEVASVSLGAIKDFESGKRIPYAHTVAALRACFEAAGVEFLTEPDGSTGLLLRAPPPSEP